MHEGFVGVDVDPLDLQRQIQAGAAQRPVDLVAQLTAGPLVQPDRERHATMRAAAYERQAPSKITAQHR